MRHLTASESPLVPAAHEDQVRPGVYKRVLITRDEVLDGRVQMINWASLPAGSSFRKHYHEDMQEIFLLLHGQARMQVAAETIDLVPGDLVVVDPREIHSMQNLGDQDVEYVVVGVSMGQGGQTVVVDGKQ